MRTIYSDKHALHHGKAELIDGEIKPCFEMPLRAHTVLERIQSVGLGAISGPTDFGLTPIAAVHDAGYLSFLENAWSEWSALGRSADALPSVFAIRGLRSDRVPSGIEGRLGYYAMDAGVPITAGTWEAVYASAQVALTGSEAIASGAQSVFSLCRPPGHHAASDYMGGYCYLNNAAIAAQDLIHRGAKRVFILDVDYHHGNGTQSIFYARNDVVFASLHADPDVEYPSFLGHADEFGTGPGDGFNRNFPLPFGTDWTAYSVALERAIRFGEATRPDAIVVSLGVDTFARDPISKFRLHSEDYLRMGEMISRLRCPTLFVFEGGYAVEEVGVNAVNVLQGFGK